MKNRALGVLLILLASGCAVGPLEPTLEELSDVADRLVSAIEKRTDLQRLRLLVYEIHPMLPQEPRASRRHPAEAVHHEATPIGSVLEHEFVLHLSDHVNIVESEHTDHQGSATEAELKKVATTTAPTRSWQATTSRSARTSTSRYASSMWTPWW